MGQALDRDGRVLDELSGATKREVFDQLNDRNPNAHEIRIRSMEDQAAKAGARQMTLAEKVDDIFKYHAPEGDQPARYEAIRAKAKELARVIIDNTPASADQTAAIRLLRECVMTANASIALKGLV